MRASLAIADRSPPQPPRTIHGGRIEGGPASPDRVAQARETAESVYRAESRRVFATLVRLLGDSDLAEEALADAFRVALEQWPRDGVPANPRAWLISTGRFKAIDGIRRRARFVAMDEVAGEVESIADNLPAMDPEDTDEDRLRPIFTCCHPALSPDARVALALREVCGLTTEEIARAFLTSTPTLAQRIVRAKAKIREALVPYQARAPAEVPERLDCVLRVIYLLFNEGYSASCGGSLTRVSLSSEGIRLGGPLVRLLPAPEAIGLFALMLLHESRRAARTSPDGDPILLPDQDRSLWDRDQIAEGSALVQRALESRRFGPYALQAAIAAVHAQAGSADATDWTKIVGLYDALLRVEPTPVVALNRAVAVAMRDGLAAGLTLVDALLARGEPREYRFAHAARMELCRRLDNVVHARESYEGALAPIRQQPGRRFLLGEQDSSSPERCRFRPARFDQLVSNGLLPPGTARTIRLRGGGISPTDGPYVETKEQLGSYYLITARRSTLSGRARARITRW
jgi:RNA polymerase sigma-70 factor (ECF subfamily)